MTIPILYLPSILYRLTLKSTAWAWAPLVWIAHTPSKLRTDEGRRVWVGYAGRTWLDLFTFFSAAAVFAWAIWLTFDPARYDAMIAANEASTHCIAMKLKPR
jgi:hypothetical protein